MKGESVHSCLDSPCYCDNSNACDHVLRRADPGGLRHRDQSRSSQFLSGHCPLPSPTGCPVLANSKTSKALSPEIPNQRHDAVTVTILACPFPAVSASDVAMAYRSEDSLAHSA